MKRSLDVLHGLRRENSFCKVDRLANLGPWVSLESVVFLLPGVEVCPTLRLPAAKMQNDKKFRIDTFGDETYALRACLRDRPNSSPILRSFVLPVLAKAIMNH
jgi:hypothetical protein